MQRRQRGDFVGLSTHRRADHDVDVEDREGLGAECGPHVDSRSLGLFLKRHDPGDLEPEKVLEVTTEGPLRSAEVASETAADCSAK